MKEINLLTLSHNALTLYAALCKPVCRELGIPQTAFDILMLLTNHSKLSTAREITDYSGIKKNLVSTHVEKLVAQGYLKRAPVPKDRRQVRLVVTDKALSVIEKGRRMQRYYYDFLTQGLTETELVQIQRQMTIVAANIDALSQKLHEDAPLE